MAQQQKPTLARITSRPTMRHDCDILLANFQIKKRRYRVLLNYDHLVWERLDEKRADAETQQLNNKKAATLEAERLSHSAVYGSNSNLVHIDDMVRVTISASKQKQPPPPDSLDSASGSEVSARLSSASSSSAATSSVASSTAATTQAQYLTLHYAARVNKSTQDCNRWRVVSICFYNADPHIVQQWHAALSKMLLQQQRVKRLLVFINPYGGRKNALTVYERYCKPLFQLAGIDASCIISQRANQIRDILMSHDLTPFDAVCCAGGDGTVAEVINGLLFRALRDHGLDMRQPEYVPKPSLPIGIIPAGSTDTIAYSLHGTSDVRTAAIHLILGQRRGLDICSVKNSEGLLRFCASVMSYGYLGDVAAKSEQYRWMGTKRYEYTGVKAFLMNRGYDAELRILLPPPDEQLPPTAPPTPGSPDSEFFAGHDMRCLVNCQRCVESAIRQSLDNRSNSNSNSNFMTPSGTPTTEILDSSSMARTYKTTVDSNNSDSCKRSALEQVDNFKRIVDESCDKEPEKCVIEPALADEDAAPTIRVNGGSRFSSNVTLEIGQAAAGSVADQSSNQSLRNSVSDEFVGAQQWRVIRGEFFMISGANITCACSRSPNGISRFNHLGDGQLDLILVRKTTLLNNVRFAMNTMGQKGDIRNLPFVETYRTSRFSFRSLHPSQEEHSVTGSCQPISGAHEADDLDEKISRWNCDGEVVNDLDIIMSSHCQLVDVFTRGPHEYLKETTTNKKSLLCCFGFN